MSMGWTDPKTGILTPSGGTAKTLVLIGLILDIISLVIFLLVSIVAIFLLPFGILGIVLVVLVWVFSYARIRDGNYEGARTPTLVWAILSFLTLSIITGVLYLIAWVKLGDAVQEQHQAVYGQPSWVGPGYAHAGAAGSGYPPAAYPAQTYAAPAAGAPQYPPQAYPTAAYPASAYAAPAYGAPAYPAAPSPAAAAPAPTATPATPLCPRCGQPAMYVAQYSRWYCARDQAYL